MRLRARNVLKGTVKNNCQGGAVNSEIVIEIASKEEVVAVITNESVSRPGLTVGKSAYAAI